MSEGLNRRDFLVRGAVAGAGILGAGWLASCARSAVSTAASASQTLTGALADTAQAPVAQEAVAVKSRVGLYTNEGLMDADTVPNLEKVLAMLDRGMMYVFGADSPETAWKQVASPQDVVALKVNCICRHLSTNPVVSYAIAQRLMDVGLPPQNIIIFDRTSRELTNAGYELVKSGTAKPYCYGTDGDYGEEFTYETFSGKLSNILLQKATVLINVPVLKTHGASQVTIALKNHFGTVHNPGACHRNIDMTIPSISATEPIKTKTRLAILDATRACFAGGPSPPPASMWTFKGVAVASDPVALDFVGNRIVNNKRTSENMGPISKNPEGVATHLLNAARMGLGKASEGEIDLVHEQLT
ncbi:MAG: DUF362 domain-containing protein [candidate division WS1 bacterium]|jgi:uncharacterized protein (DUF362 family)|nr:DUF362 domain-containing protein [candidate division WS1 bacterium]